MTGEVHLDDGKYVQVATRAQENRGIRSSDGCGETSVPSTMVRGYDFHRLGGYLGNPGLSGISDFTALGRFIEFYVAAYKEAATHSAFRSRGRLATRRTLGRVMHLLSSLSPRARQLTRIESRQIGLRPAAYTSEGWIPGRRYCSGQGPECHETQLGWIAVAAIFVGCAAAVF
jgi:hypothetical protein